MLNEAQRKYKSEIAGFIGLPDENIFLYWKGRVALYGLLKAMGVKEGDEIILPAFTCVVVPNAIMYLGAKPVYVDIDRDTYNIDTNLIVEKITPLTKIIIAQNTFGLSPDLDSIISIAQKHNLRVIEDCTHGFGGHYKGKKNGIIAEASFFSTQWNKPYSSGIGGFLILRNSSLIKVIRETNNALEKTTLKDEWILKTLIKARRYLVNSSYYYPLISLYRWLSKTGLVIGSSSGGELKNTIMPHKYFKGMSSVQAEEGSKELKKINVYIEKRKWIAGKYNSLLLQSGIPTPFIPTGVEHTYLKYPLLVSDRAKFMESAINAKIEIGDWFISPLHPVRVDLSKWCFNIEHYPVAGKAGRHIVNLPTDPLMNEKQLNKVLGFISSHRNLIMPSI